MNFRMPIQLSQKRFEPRSHGDTEKLKNLCDFVSPWLAQFVRWV